MAPEAPPTGPGQELPDLDRGPLRFHIVGVGGAAMNGIAALLIAMGHSVSGSDLQRSPVLERLDGLGARTFIGHDPAHVGEAEIVAFSTAVNAGNVELAEARRRGIPTLTRAEVLAAICHTRRTLAVSGTHGKTTTTAMLAAVLVEAGFEPGFLVGGELPGGGGGASWGSGKWFVVEADESDGTFLRLGAEGVVVTNVEVDHLDYYGDEAAIARAFHEFVEQAPGARVLCADDPGSAALSRAIPGVTTYGGFEGSTYRISGVQLSALGASFELSTGGRNLGRFQLGVPGLHNVLNATAAIAMALEVGAEPDAARDAMAAYSGVGRRYEFRGEANGVTYIDDYAHNPGKVRAALATARNGQWGRVVAVFQPHRYSRTASLSRDFADAFDGADVVVVTAVYSAGEQPLPGVSGRLVADAISASHPAQDVEYAETRAELVAVLERVLRPGDLCLTMSAGDLTTLPDELLERAAQSGRARQ
ncbi:MAG TPA: UDP-N-acetylmuramate--L-alanine ligase [Acidimicrobiales bacterium]|nr:UDP-N-acetylmuramate--L-alanine ligase [Acidimicrobiales bacterium]